MKNISHFQKSILFNNKFTRHLYIQQALLCLFITISSSSLNGQSTDPEKKKKEIFNKITGKTSVYYKTCKGDSCWKESKDVTYYYFEPIIKHDLYSNEKCTYYDSFLIRIWKFPWKLEEIANRYSNIESHNEYPSFLSVSCYQNNIPNNLKFIVESETSREDIELNIVSDDEFSTNLVHPKGKFQDNSIKYFKFFKTPKEIGDFMKTHKYPLSRCKMCIY